ncbi:FabD/lysophospholipase-like protein [Patellaria atrata CBS 101060]|uniref:FabD/lysophospholipase-like protein n=1 Tax=Patellaria atrata CBS 101060 TaxID=1346257 RepID=A0A9P4SES5_9PEZI|nr:FabD/lysophospholipase-like protein [Patellaria atrata CBS 101060]
MESLDSSVRPISDPLRHESPSISLIPHFSPRSRFSLRSASATSTSQDAVLSQTGLSSKSSTFSSSDGSDPGVSQFPSVKLPTETIHRTVFNVQERKKFVPNCWLRQMVLSLDGGGVRGLASLYILEQLMIEVVKKELEIDESVRSSDASPFVEATDVISESRNGILTSDDMVNHERFLPCHYFDYIGGTSMSGIIAVMLGRLQLPVSGAIQRYEKLCREMAINAKRSSRMLSVRKRFNNALDNALLKSIFSDDLGNFGKPNELLNLGSDRNKCKTIVLAMEVDRKQGVWRPHLFRSYEFKPVNVTSFNRNTATECEPTPLKSLCQVTAASPKYFRSVRIGNRKFYDGSSWMTNPAMEMYREIDAMHPMPKRNVSPMYGIVSIGCGSRRSGLIPSKAATRHDWEQKLVDKKLSLGQGTGHDRYRYIRLDPDTPWMNSIDTAPGIDAEKTIRLIREATTEYCKRDDVRVNIESCASLIVQYRHQRARTPQWERFALGVRYSCTLCQEVGRDAGDLGDRDDFADHLLLQHKAEYPDTRAFAGKRGLASFRTYPNR